MRYLLAPLVAWTIAQTAKVIFYSVREHRLNERQGRAIEFLMVSPQMAIADFEDLCPDVSRRTLQRDLAALEARGLIRHEGETNQLVYKPTEKL